jgi:acetyltransferase-like isoleucine patch superfamily enzyme
MTNQSPSGSRIVPAVHGMAEVTPDPAYIRQLAEDLAKLYGSDGLLDLYSRFLASPSAFDAMMRKVLCHAFLKSCGDGLKIEAGVQFKHPETFEIGTGVFIGNQSFLQGRFDGRFKVGNHVWIGPQSYFDARDLVLEDYVGWGPGAKVLGSAHTGIPADVPVIRTDLEIRPVRVDAWADIGTNAVLLPGVRVGKAAVVGAGALVRTDVPAFSIVAGVPAQIIGWRTTQVE